MQTKKSNPTAETAPNYLKGVVTSIYANKQWSISTDSQFDLWVYNIFLTPMNYRSTINPTVSLGINQQISKTAVGSPRTSAPNKVLKGAGGGGGVSTYGAAMAFGLLKMEVCMISK